MAGKATYSRDPSATPTVTFIVTDLQMGERQNRTMTPSLGKRIFVLVRDKLGESMFAFASLRAFALRNPNARIVLLARDAYAPLFPATPNVRVVRYRNSVQATLFCLGERLLGRRYDALAILKGYGKRTAKLCRLISARRRVSSNPLLDVPGMEILSGPDSEKRHYYPAWLTLKMLDPGLPFPDSLTFPQLAAMRDATAADAVAICPVSEEERRCFTPAALRHVVGLAARAHPGKRIRVLVRNGSEQALLHGAHPEGVDIVRFQTLPTLLALFATSAHYYGTDSGLLHIALAMGMPATVIFGQSNPDHVVLPGQPGVRRIRLAGLGETVCPMDQCLRGDCIEWAAGNAVGGATDLQLQDFCPLNGLPRAALADNRDF